MTRSLLIGGLVGILLAMLLVAPVRAALSALESVRAEARALERQAAGPHTPIVAPANSWSGGADAAAAGVAARVGAAAARAGVLAEEAVPVPAPAPALAAVRLRLSGSEHSVLGLVEGLERGTPLIRLHQWRITGLPEGGVRLEAVAILPWR